MSEIEKYIPTHDFKDKYSSKLKRVVVDNFNNAFSLKIARKLVKKYPMILFVFVVSTSDSNLYKRQSDFSMFTLSFSIKEITEYLSNWGLSQSQITAAHKIHFENFAHLRGYAQKERLTQMDKLFAELAKKLDPNYYKNRT